MLLWLKAHARVVCSHHKLGDLHDGAQCPVDPRMFSELILFHYLDVSNTLENNIKHLCLHYYTSPSYSASIFLLSLKKCCVLFDVRIPFMYQRKMKKKTLAEADEPE